MYFVSKAVYYKKNKENQKASALFLDIRMNVLFWRAVFASPSFPLYPLKERSDI